MFIQSVAIHCISLALAVVTATSAASVGVEGSPPCKKVEWSDRASMRPLYQGTGIAKYVFTSKEVGGQDVGLFAWYLKDRNSLYLSSEHWDTTIFSFTFDPHQKNVAPQTINYMLDADWGRNCIASIPALAASNGATYSVLVSTEIN